jgi:tetratricopeptide (TPR) repeat protein
MSQPADAIDTVDAPAPAGAPPRPVAFFMQAPGRKVGPLTREDLVGYFQAGLVPADAMLVGPDWSGALTAAAAAEWLGVALRAKGPGAPAVRTPAGLPPAPLEYRRFGLGWRLVVLWTLALLAVQLGIVPAQSLGANPGLVAFVGVVAWRFTMVAVACTVVVGGALRLARGAWPGARGPLLAMTAVYVVLGLQFVMRPRLPAATPEAAPAVVAAPAAAEAETFVDPGAESLDAWIEANPAEPALASADVTDAQAPPAASAASAAATAAVSPAATAVRRVDRDPRWTQASALYRAGDWNALLTLATAWTEDEPRSKNAWIYLGLAHERLGHRAEAIAANRQAYAIDPDDKVIANNLGNTLLDTGEFREAATIFEGLLAREPDNYRALNDYGYAMSRLGEYDEAVEALEHAVKVEPGYSRAWHNLINTYAGAGYLDKARDAAGRANSRR